MIWKIYLGVAAVVALLVIGWASYCVWLELREVREERARLGSVITGQFPHALFLAAIVGLFWLPILATAVIGTVLNWSKGRPRSGSIT